VGTIGAKCTASSTVEQWRIERRQMRRLSEQRRKLWEFEEKSQYYRS